MMRTPRCEAAALAAILILAAASPARALTGREVHDKVREFETGP
jgi:hypothetical protein